MVYTSFIFILKMDQWHIDLNWKNAVKDFIEYEQRFQIRNTKNFYDGWDNNLDYFEIYPYDETKLLPKYVYA
jgi:hypothetical protein